MNTERFRTHHNAFDDPQRDEARMQKRQEQMRLNAQVSAEDRVRLALSYSQQMSASADQIALVERTIKNVRKREQIKKEGLQALTYSKWRFLTRREAEAVAKFESHYGLVPGAESELRWPDRFPTRQQHLRLLTTKWSGDLRDQFFKHQCPVCGYFFPPAYETEQPYRRYGTTGVLRVCPDCYRKKKLEKAKYFENFHMTPWYAPAFSFLWSLCPVKGPTMSIETFLPLYIEQSFSSVRIANWTQLPYQEVKDYLRATQGGSV